MVNNYQLQNTFEWIEFHKFSMQKIDLLVVILVGILLAKVSQA